MEKSIEIYLEKKGIFFLWINKKFKLLMVLFWMIIFLEIEHLVFIYRMVIKHSDVVYVELSLEQLSNGGWHTIKSQTHTTYNNDFAYTGLSFSVAMDIIIELKDITMLKQEVK